jgi:hypothetical protein
MDGGGGGVNQRGHAAHTGMPACPSYVRTPAGYVGV